MYFFVMCCVVCRENLNETNVPFCPHGCLASMRPVVFLYKGTRRKPQGGLVLRVETGGVMPLTTDSL